MPWLRRLAESFGLAYALAYGPFAGSVWLGAALWGFEYPLTAALGAAWPASWMLWPLCYPLQAKVNARVAELFAAMSRRRREREVSRILARGPELRGW